MKRKLCLIISVILVIAISFSLLYDFTDLRYNGRLKLENPSNQITLLNRYCETYVEEGFMLSDKEGTFYAQENDGAREYIFYKNVERIKDADKIDIIVFEVEYSLDSMPSDVSEVESWWGDENILNADLSFKIPFNYTIYKSIESGEIVKSQIGDFSVSNFNMGVVAQDDLKLTNAVRGLYGGLNYFNNTASNTIFCYEPNSSFAEAKSKYKGSYSDFCVKVDDENFEKLNRDKYNGYKVKPNFKYAGYTLEVGYDPLSVKELPKATFHIDLEVNLNGKQYEKLNLSKEYIAK